MPEQIPEGSVVITPSEQYQRTAEQFGTITEQLSGIKETLNPLPAQVAEHDAFINSLREVGLPGSMTTVKAEVTRIDRVQVKGLGIAAAIGGGFGALGWLIPLIVK
ncbi:MAG: hypothetical protein ACRDTJ_31720 [Pseudonocardiaceae bacterium]